jgi:hypothetical protein
MNDAPQRRAYAAWEHEKLEKLRAEDAHMPYMHEPVQGRKTLSLSEAARLDALEYVALHPGQHVETVQKTFQDFREQMESSNLQKMDYMTKYVFDPNFYPPAHSLAGAATNIYSRGMIGSSREGDTVHRPASVSRVASAPVPYKPNNAHEWYYDHIARKGQEAAEPKGKDRLS